MIEEWRPVVGFEDYYSVSDAGRVRSEARTIIRQDGSSTTVRTRLMKQAMGVDCPYLTVSLSHGGVATTRYVAHLVLQAFDGPCPAGMEACHGDGKSDNNRRVNLRWDTRPNNHADKLAHGTATIGEKNPAAVLTDESVSRLRARRADGVSYRKLAAEFGVSPMTAYRAAVGESWSHL